MARGVNNLLSFYLQRITDINVKPVIEVRLVSKKLAINHNWYWFLVCDQIFMCLGAKLHGCRYQPDRYVCYNLDQISYICGFHCIKHRYNDIKFTARYRQGFRRLCYKLKIGFMSYRVELRPISSSDDVLFCPKSDCDWYFTSTVDVRFAGILILDTKTNINNLDEFVAWVIKYRKK